MSTIGRASLDVVPNTTGFQAQAQRGLAPVVRKIAAGLAVAFAAQRVFDFGKQAVEEAALVQKATENIKANYGSQSDAILDFADKAAKSYGISKAASEDFSSSLAITAKNLGLTNAQAAEEAQGYQKLAGAVGLIKGVDPASYFDKLKMAMLGNTRGLKQMGISFSSAQLKQEALVLGIKGATSTWTAGEKAQVIYGLATKHLGEFMAQAKQHSSDLADQQIKLKAQLDNVKEEIGAALLPQVVRLASFLQDNLPGAIRTSQQILAGFRATFAELTSIIPGGTTAIYAMVAAFVAWQASIAVGSLIAPLVTGIGTIISGMTALISVYGAAGAASELLAASMVTLRAAMVTTGIGAVVVGLGLLVAYLWHASTETDGLTRASNDAASAVRNLASALDATKSAANAHADAVLAAKRAALTLAQAEQNLSDLRKSGTASALQIKDAELSVKEARQGLSEANGRAKSTEHQLWVSRSKSAAQAKRTIKDYVDEAAAINKSLPDRSKFLVGQDKINYLHQRGAKFAQLFGAKMRSTAADIVQSTHDNKHLSDSQLEARRTAELMALAARDVADRVHRVPKKWEVNLFFKQHPSLLISQLQALRQAVLDVPLNRQIVFSIHHAGALPPGSTWNNVFAQTQAGGGVVRGGVQGRDSVPILAKPGEWVVNEGQQKVLTNLLFGTGNLLKGAAAGGKATPTVSFNGPVTIETPDAGDFMGQLQQLAWRSA